MIIDVEVFVLEYEIIKKLEKYNFGDFIFNTNHWIVFLAPQQSNIGTCVVALNREAEDLSSLTSEEWTEFGDLVGKLEFAVRKCFGVTMYNWGSLMNASYLETPPNPHVHWHFIPRYNHEVKFDGLIFEDPYFGTMRPRPFRAISNEIRKNIIDIIKSNIPDI
jgi:diadenosine tetraphosphate (Ap4A) HIT family hydrolase